MTELTFSIKKNDKTEFTKTDIYDSVNLFKSFFSPSIEKLFQPKYEYYNSRSTFYNHKLSYALTCYYHKAKWANDDNFVNFIRATVLLFESSTKYNLLIIKNRTNSH